jgi:hypothetical protein
MIEGVTFGIIGAVVVVVGGRLMMALLDWLLDHSV